MKTHESQNSPLKLAEFINLGKVHPGCHKEPHFRTFSSIFFCWREAGWGHRRQLTTRWVTPPPPKEERELMVPDQHMIPEVSSSTL